MVNESILSRLRVDPLVEAARGAVDAERRVSFHIEGLGWIASSSFDTANGGDIIKIHHDSGDETIFARDRLIAIRLMGAAINK